MIFEGRNRVTSGFRLAARPNHNGIDIVGAQVAYTAMMTDTMLEV